MHSLIVLERSLLEENIEDVKNYFLDVDRRTSNETMQRMGDSLGFQVMEIDGICYAHLSSTSQLLGYSNVSGLRYLMSTYQIQTPKIGWFIVELQKIIRNFFNLDPKDGQATFLPYAGILVAGMEGKTDGAKKIKLYLLKMEEAARIGSAVSVDQGKAESQKMKDEIFLIKQVDNMAGGPFRDRAVETLERFTGKNFPRSKQMGLPFKEN